jgi:hypothetical protein
MPEITKVPGVTERIDTGPLQFGDDWPGVFFRGADALNFANDIALALTMDELPKTALSVRAILTGLRDELRSCAVAAAMPDRKPRQRDHDYLDYIRSMPCCICGDDVSVEAHHPRVGSINGDKQQDGTAQRAADMWALPLCGRHHRELHATGERVFWASVGIDPIALAMHYRARPR